MISNKEVKRTFKILLDSNRANSFTGSIFNATYPIDLTHIIFDDKDFDKSYYMNCTFISKANTVALNQVTTTDTYTLHIDMGKGLNIYQYNQVKNSSFIVPVSIALETLVAGVFTPYTYFNLTDDLQKPVFLQNIRNMNYITLNLIQSNNATFSPGTPANSAYVCMLTFTEA